MIQKYCLVFLGLLLLHSALFAAGKKPVIEPKPSWVKENAIDYSVTQMDEEAQDGFSDLHFEKQVSLQQQAMYVRKAVHILSEAGVQNHARVSVDFDPTYQSLAFHSIRILRGKEVINQLQLSRIKVLQQEEELDRFLYNGSLTAVLILDDVRTGDIVEYSYTIKGFNPIFKNRYAAIFETAFSFPIYNLQYRVLVPKERTLNMKTSLTNMQPVLSSNGSETVYEWKATNVPAIQADNQIPTWYDPYPSVMVSEYNSWSEVVAWASALFPFGASLPADLQKKVADIKTKYNTPEARLLAALRFVQDDVRYMGFEMGINSHKPHDPLQTFRQRFGDCKDKAYLLCTLLRGLDIEAYPVLINTYYKKTITNWLPSPTAFDHTTVCAVLDGKRYWFDPTISSQRGPLQAIAYPNYQLGLLVGPTTTALTTIPLQDNGQVSTREIFSVKEINGAVRLKVITEFSGSFADDTRYNFKSSGLAEIKKKYKEFYGAYFRKINMDSLSYRDNEETGVFTTTEHYTINDFWYEEEGKTKAFLRPFLINSFLKKPDDENRKMPYSLVFPTRHHEEVEVVLPEDWPVDESSFSFAHNSFSLQYRYSNPKKNVVLVSYDFENRADHVAPEQIAGFLKEINKASGSSGFEIYTTGNARVAGAVATSSASLFTIAYFVLGLCLVITYAVKNQNRRR